jgi:hypothetical protein
VGEFGVKVRSIGAAMLGAVRVVGGAENVMLPRLPMELPLPMRASAMAGASRSTTAAAIASKRELARDIWFVTLFKKRT